MKLLLNCIFDGAIGAYQVPFYSRTKLEASRQFADACADKNSPFSKHASDYTLYCVGGFDDATGMVETFDPFVKICTALEAIAEYDNAFENIKLRQN